MKRYSIFYSITLISIMSVVFISLAFAYLITYEKQSYTEQLNLKYSRIAEATLIYLNDVINQDDFINRLNHYNLEEITEEPLKSYIALHGQVLDEKSVRLGKSAIIFYNNDNYLKVTSKNTTMLFRDEDFQVYKYDVIAGIFGVIVLVVIGVYIYIIRKIKPLKRLKRQIEKFASGDLNIPNKQTGNDEISEVANAFYESVHHIKKLNHSRQVFLRNIMHELKTPITKGRICVEMIEEGKQKQRLISVFERLETMINELAAIEQLTSGEGLKQKTEKRRFVDILDEAIDLSLINKDSIDFDINEDMVLNVDFKLFSIAIKNILDNGVKYSKDGRIKIIADSQCMHFITSGDALSHPFEYYLSPFTQGHHSKQGLGLGLYIVDNIIKAHKLKFSYKHENGKNIFSFLDIKKIIHF